MRFRSSIAIASLAAAHACDALAVGGRPGALIRADNGKRAPLQDIVTFDERSLFINGERVMIFSGEIHPYRLPVPSLWADVLRKIKALGLNTVSIYIDWAQLEGKPGDFSAEGIFDYARFFDVAKEVGLYAIARPGPYINAEASGGGFPGWLQRVKGFLRTTDKEYLAATDNYMEKIGAIIAKAQITNGGPVILFQPENEYSGAVGVEFPEPEYMQYVEDQARKAGIVVPLMSNDAFTGAHNAPGTGVGEVDIYGHDGYPLGFDCANPTSWPADALPTNWYATHMNQSASTPYTIPEFQGGAFDPWGGWGFEQCAELVNHEQVRVFYKNNYAAGVTIYNLYMIFGGTNWGNLGHPGGYTSYDYGSVIGEDRTVTREKYSELKLEANFLKVSPGYLTAIPAMSSVTGVYSGNKAMAVTSLEGDDGSFFVVRHADYQQREAATYTLTLPISGKNLTIPQLGGSLTLSGRDTKIHVTNYPVGDVTLLYSTAEIFTWQKFEDKTVLVVYGGEGELHELAVKSSSAVWEVDGEGVTVKEVGGDTVAQWKTSQNRRVIHTGNLDIYVLDRNSAYNYWVPELSSKSSLIVNGPYLVRSASISGDKLELQADFNTTTDIEIIGVPRGVSKLVINGGDEEKFSSNARGNPVAKISYPNLNLALPDLAELDWNSIDSLPEIQPGYDDGKWVDADLKTTNNTFVQPFLTPVSLYGSDYGFHTGALLFHGHFTATGSETKLDLSTAGGRAFGSSVWLDEKFLGSWTGIDASETHNDTYKLPNLVKGKPYTLTVLIDNMGLNENWVVGVDDMKHARGILNYTVLTKCGRSAPDITWKLTGNLGGEDYADRTRGPLNEGGLFVERMGYHLPAPPLDKFKSGAKPLNGLAQPGVFFFAANMALDLPSDKWDIPLSFAFKNATETDGGAYRAWLYVNGFQYGRYVSNVGPQTVFPVPEGILNYGGDNWIGLAVWALESGGAKVPGFDLVAGTPVLTGRDVVQVVDAPAWEERPGAY